MSTVTKKTLQNLNRVGKTGIPNKSFANLNKAQQMSALRKAGLLGSAKRSASKSATKSATKRKTRGKGKHKRCPKGTRRYGARGCLTPSAKAQAQLAKRVARSAKRRVSSARKRSAMRRRVSNAAARAARKASSRFRCPRGMVQYPRKSRNCVRKSAKPAGKRGRPKSSAVARRRSQAALLRAIRKQGKVPAMRKLSGCRAVPAKDCNNVPGCNFSKKTGRCRKRRSDYGKRKSSVGGGWFF